MQHFFRFPSIGQFREVVKQVRHRFNKAGDSFPVLKFVGSVKLHGTNAAIICPPNSEPYFQSRNRIITPVNDNAGFATYMQGVVGTDGIDNLLNVIKEKLVRHTHFISFTDTIAIYGEWCGGNVQPGVALSELDKMFVIFGIRYGLNMEKEDATTTGYWADMSIFDDDCCFPEHNIFFSSRFVTFEQNIDFDNPAESVNVMVDITNRVEAECPVGKYFGVSGIGEGVVWRCLDPWFSSSRYWFKVKGEKHSATKVKKLVTLDPEKAKGVVAFIDYSVTENRLNQGIEFLKEMNKPLDRTSTGVFVKWITTDVVKEELDTMVASGLELKDINKSLSKKAAGWYLGKVDVISEAA